MLWETTSSCLAALWCRIPFKLQPVHKVCNKGEPIQQGQVNFKIFDWFFTEEQLKLSVSTHIQYFCFLPSDLGYGCSVRVEGEIVGSPARGQSIELQATNVQVIGTCDAGVKYSVLITIFYPHNDDEGAFWICCRENEKMLVTMIFSFFQQSFLPSERQITLWVIYMRVGQNILTQLLVCPLFMPPYRKIRSHCLKCENITWKLYIFLLLLHWFSYKAHIWYEGTSHQYTSGGTKFKVICQY